MALTDIADEIAHSMQQALKENSPAPEANYFSGIASQLAGTAGELDQVGSSLAGKVDHLLGEIVNTLGED
jgi:hypothetical protein